MKLNRKHIRALDIAISSVLARRDKAGLTDEAAMLGLNANRLRQLRILLIEACIQPDLNLSGLFHTGIDDNSDLVKGIRMLTGHCETDEL
jgi:hypothetical protein